MKLLNSLDLFKITFWSHLIVNFYMNFAKNLRFDIYDLIYIEFTCEECKHQKFRKR